MKYPIVDAHCDLLGYLHFVKGSNPHNPVVRCSLPQLRNGQVALQVLAIFTMTTDANSSGDGRSQSVIYKRLLEEQKDHVVPLSQGQSLSAILHADKTAVIAAIENASGFCSEKDTFEQGIQNLENIIANTGRIFYIGLTHHLENRFGGGNHATAGLKDDGKRLLDYLSGKRIAVDLAHTSDALAQGIFNHVDKNNLDIPILASHSNFRAIFNNARNLPDELAQEVFRRNGVIGLNWLKFYLGETSDSFYRHLEHGLKLGGEGKLGLGADFFYHELKPGDNEIYFGEYCDASCYCHLMEQLSKRGILTGEQLDGFAYKNMLDFMERSVLVNEELGIRN